MSTTGRLAADDDQETKEASEAKLPRWEVVLRSKTCTGNYPNLQSLFENVARSIDLLEVGQ